MICIERKTHSLNVFFNSYWAAFKVQVIAYNLQTSALNLYKYPK